MQLFIDDRIRNKLSLLKSRAAGDTVAGSRKVLFAQTKKVKVILTLH